MHGSTVEPVDDYPVDGTRLAVVHSYIHHGKDKYIGAPEESEVQNWKKRLSGYHAAVFGDNHKGFLSKAGDCNILNCGCIFPRKSDEREYRPAVGILYDDGTIRKRRLSTDKDVWLTDVVAGSGETEGMNLSEFLEDLEDLVGDKLDFNEALNRCLDSKEIRTKVRDMLMEAMDV